MGCPDATCVLGKAMIDSIRAWITGNGRHGREGTGRQRDELQLALTALLIEAAYSDDHFAQAERAVISRLIKSRFNLALTRCACSARRRGDCGDRSS